MGKEWRAWERYGKGMLNVRGIGILALVIVPGRAMPAV